MGRDSRRLPTVQTLSPVLEHLTCGRQPEDSLLTGHHGGLSTTASVPDVTNWDQLVTEIELASLTRHVLRHTGATWLTNAGIVLHVLQNILDHNSIDATRGYIQLNNGTSAMKTVADHGKNQRPVPVRRNAYN